MSDLTDIPVTVAKCRSPKSMGMLVMELVSYAGMLLLTVGMHQSPEAINIHVSISVFSMGIILIGSLRSLNVLVDEMHGAITDPSKESQIENMSKEDAMQFPVFAGGTLCALYGAMKYFGKEVVNQFLLVYIAFGSTAGVKSLL